MINDIIIAYLIICAIIAIVVIVLFAKEDFDRYRNKVKQQPKFPPNYRCGLSWCGLVLVSTPVVNIIIWSWLLVVMLKGKIKDANSI